MPRFFEKTLLILLMGFTVFAIGCETTDYEPLIMKKKLKELEAKIDSLEKEVSELKGTEESTDSSASSEEDAGASNETGAADTRSAMASESLENFLIKDDSGLVVQADLTNSRQLESSVSKLAGFKHLKKIFLDGSRATASTFESLGRVSSLEHLEIAGSNPSPRRSGRTETT